MRRQSVFVLFVGFLLCSASQVLAAPGSAVTALPSSQIHGPMMALQVLVETYAVDWGGVYPENVSALKAAALEDPAYWKELVNPYTKASGKGKAYLDFSQFDAADETPGLVLYQVDSDHSSYTIRGTDQDGSLVQSQGVDYILSNS